ncbi:GcrA family cell cycle regulator [Hoeflea sp. CAU 1731]
MNENHISWTPERDRTLLMLWRLGFRPTQIMVMLGGVTRNGVIGRYLRLQSDGPMAGYLAGGKIVRW